MVGRFRSPLLARWVPGLLRKRVKTWLKKEFGNARTIRDIQLKVQDYVTELVERTTTRLTTSGLERMDRNTAYLFVCNHRDTVFDPMVINHLLHSHGFETTRIAIGDNLLTKPWVSDLMRLNKSFIVRRSAAGPRELLAASRHLSGYIRHALTEQHANVWIAQREGRAKDGIDRTEPAVIKMLSLSRDKASEDFGDHIASLGIVPVAISYEIDPCDALKARELAERARTGAYEKGEQEDVASIGVGIAGSKGRVHVSFGTPLDRRFDSAAAVAAEIDRQVLAGFRLHPSNLQAYEILEGRPAPASLHCEEGSVSAAAFRARMEAIPAEHRPYALAIYANAVRSQLALREAA